MVEVEGPIEVASQRTDSQRGGDRKVDQIMCELTKYDVTVGALQETEWLGDDVYQMNADRSCK